MSIVPFHFTASPKNSIQLAIKQEYKTSCSLEGTHAKRHINITVSKAVAPSFLECNLSKCCLGRRPICLLQGPLGEFVVAQVLVLEAPLVEPGEDPLLPPVVSLPAVLDLEE